jgi:nicotinic acid phosphoribosyltransferase
MGNIVSVFSIFNKNNNPITDIPIGLLTDSYKASHPYMLPYAYKMVAYGEMRSPLDIVNNKNNPIDQRIIFYGIDYIIKTYISKPITQKSIDDMVSFYKTHSIGGSYDIPDFNNFLKSGHIPIKIYALPEGTVILPHTPVYRIEAYSKDNADCVKLITFFETLLTQVWYPSTVATLSRMCRQQIFDGYISCNLDDSDFKYIFPYSGDYKENNYIHINNYINCQMHDFGFRGTTCVEQAIIGGTSHLLNFRGTDTVPAAYYAQNVLNNGIPVAESIPATEHSVMTSFMEDTVINWENKKINLHPEQMALYTIFQNYLINSQKTFNIFAIVMDSYNYEFALFHELPDMLIKIYGFDLSNKDGICNGFINHKISNNWNVVLRPDSGDSILSVMLGLLAGASIFGYHLIGKTNQKYIVLKNCSIIQGDGINYHTISEILLTMRTPMKKYINNNTFKYIDHNNNIQYASSFQEYVNIILEKIKIKYPDSINFIIKLQYNINYIIDNNYAFSPKSVSFGMGGSLLQKVNRDSMSFATKLSYIMRIDGSKRYVMKKPSTDFNKYSIPGISCVKFDKDNIPCVYSQLENNNPNVDLLKLVYDGTKQDCYVRYDDGYIPYNNINYYDISYPNTYFDKIRKRINIEWENLKPYAKYGKVSNNKEPARNFTPFLKIFQDCYEPSTGTFNDFTKSIYYNELSYNDTQIINNLLNE